MRGTDMPVTPESIRSRFLAYHAAWLVRAETERGNGDPEIQELAALLIRVEHGEGSPEVRVRCLSDSGTGHWKTAVIIAGLRIDGDHLPAHSPIAYGPTRNRDGQLKAHEWIKRRIWRKDPARSQLVVDKRVPVRWETDPRP
ncbi:hypothetical protein OG800_50400 (plasmid) [Streptomyces sp. NBC_00445]|uniref:hypothetical protein n=1 Tax=Streptomyces sp. NBC_00445 TaxID=2975745 RepID=UPI002E24EC8E